MAKKNTLSLSDRDKTPKPSGWGYYFHHTNPQRRVVCILGDMLAPLSADDIPPISPAAMVSVQAALTLLAHLVGDQDFGRFLSASDARLEEYHMKAKDILLAARGLAGILRVTSMSMASAPMPTDPCSDSCETAVAEVACATITRDNFLTHWAGRLGTNTTLLENLISEYEALPQIRRPE